MPRPDWPTAAPYVPPQVGARPDLATLAAAMDGCRGCPLWEPATQAVPGAGPADARVVLVGEQPGDQEDRAGRPFVGPAGRLLDEALETAGIDRSTAYVTNAVKHFKFRAQGQAPHPRLPDAGRCGPAPWLQAEMAALRPEVSCCSGDGRQGGLRTVVPSDPEPRVLLPWPPSGDGVRYGSGPGARHAAPSAVLRADDRAAALAGLRRRPAGRRRGAVGASGRT
jgi:DNA polymerase